MAAGAALSCRFLEQPCRVLHRRDGFLLLDGSWFLAEPVQCLTLLMPNVSQQVWRISGLDVNAYPGNLVQGFGTLSFTSESEPAAQQHVGFGECS
jgi:hypothetical protein